MSPIVHIQQDLANDTLIVEQTDELGAKTRRSIPRYELGLRAGTADNDININTLYGHRALYNQNAAATNAYLVRQSFPRSEQDMDAIMIRRVNARLQLKQEKYRRHLWHLGIGALVVIFAPLAFTAVMRMWWGCMAWMAS